MRRPTTDAGIRVRGRRAAVISKNGCTIDLKKICQGLIDQPEFPMNNERYSWQRFVNNSRPHEDVLLPASALSPDLDGTVQCHIATHNRTATGAELLNGPSTDKTIDYLKNKGWCAESSPDYDKLIASVLQEWHPR